MHTRQFEAAISLIARIAIALTVSLVISAALDERGLGLLGWPIYAVLGAWMVIGDTRP